jgi:hypothetical protein
LTVLLVGAATFGVRSAEAAPAADAVIVWAPSADPSPISKVAKDLGLALIDRSPGPETPPEATGPLIQRGIDAYNNVQFEAAWQALERARDVVERTGALGLQPSQLSDLFLYRSLVLTERKDPNAFDEMVTSVVVDPTRILDGGRFPPRVIDEHTRARTGAQSHKGSLRIDVPAGCTTWLDGRAFDPAQALLAGAHFASVRCDGRIAWAQRITVPESGTMKLENLALQRLTPPSDADILIQARSTGVRGVIVAELHDRIGTARLIGIDGRERERRTVTISGDLTPLAEAVRVLARERDVPKQPWYESKWTWAAGAAVIAAAIAIPITAALAADNSPGSASIKGPGKL